MNTKSRRRSFTPTPIATIEVKSQLAWGFTLIELLMVIGIIIILAGIAIPNFYKAKERALTKEAIANLKLIAAAEKVYRMENTFYYPDTGGQSDIDQINRYLKLFTNEINWDYAITAATANTFTANADRKGAGPYSSCIYTLTHNDADGEPNPSGTCP